jgi:hypothetical protein
MIEVTVNLPRTSSPVEEVAARMRQQIVDAHTAAVDADSDEADRVVMFITEEYQNLRRLHAVRD